MNASLRSVLLALPLVVATAITGCAADSAGDDTAETTGAATASEAITIQNYVSHPKIAAVRQQVAAIDALTLKKAENPGCDGGNIKFTDASGKIRKLVSYGGEGGFEGETTVWYSESGTAIFAFNKQADWTGERVKNADNAWVSETRTYFEASGKTLFQAVRSAELKTFEEAVPAAADRLPTAEEKTEDASAYGDPETWFASTGCGGAEEEPGKQ